MHACVCVCAHVGVFVCVCACACVLACGRVCVNVCARAHVWGGIRCTCIALNATSLMMALQRPEHVGGTSQMTNNSLLVTVQFVGLNTMYGRLQFKNEQRMLKKVLAMKI